MLRPRYPIGEPEESLPIPGKGYVTLPFPCHPEAKQQAILNRWDPTQPVQFWEQTCAASWDCGRLWRFQSHGRTPAVEEIYVRTDPSPAQQSDPLDPFDVVARRMREGSNFVRRSRDAFRGSRSASPRRRRGRPGTSRRDHS
jgi:hypothetical protein